MSHNQNVLGLEMGLCGSTNPPVFTLLSFKSQKKVFKNCQSFVCGQVLGLMLPLAI